MDEHIANDYFQQFKDVDFLECCKSCQDVIEMENGEVVCQCCDKCEHCNEWNSLLEENVSKPSGPLSKSSGHNIKFEYLKNDTLEYPRLKTNFNEIDRVMGGGFVSGSVTLIGGDPGIGKSTLLLQLVGNLSKMNEQCIYVSGEESLSQIKMRADRLGIKDSNIQFASVTNASDIATTIGSIKTRSILIIDSIQTMYLPQIDSSPGTVTQVRACAHELIIAAKKSNSILVLIGHVTKDGNIAGPRVLEHMVDTVLQFEGDRNHVYRILRALKNRFGSTAELGIYEMLGNGLREVSNPSEILISNKDNYLSGTAIATTIEGMRPLMIEIQALVSTAVYGTPQRSTTGYNLKRLNMILAVLEKRAGFRLGAKDVFLNITGGINVDDPAIDLAVVAAILSSNDDEALAKNFCFAGEVGLSGEIRPVQRVDQRILEAEKLGFEIIFVSKHNKIGLKNTAIKVQLLTKIEDLVEILG